MGCRAAPFLLRWHHPCSGHLQCPLPLCTAFARYLTHLWPVGGRARGMAHYHCPGHRHRGCGVPGSVQRVGDHRQARHPLQLQQHLQARVHCHFTGQWGPTTKCSSTRATAMSLCLTNTHAQPVCRLHCFADFHTIGISFCAAIANSHASSSRHSHRRGRRRERSSPRLHSVHRNVPLCITRHYRPLGAGSNGVRQRLPRQLVHCNDLSGPGDHWHR
mmetsp:Transcript_719/g.2563  ORF Transcript_719/g.2563 Transcript_719/m.2563 type:complete len:217 (+) Transcript_719:145-795(+)